MKRIFVLLTLSAIMPGLCQGQMHGRFSRFSRVPIYAYSSACDYVVRYSPYAFSYHNTGLIPGGLTYSPYALGLVPEGTRYTPYAFSYNDPGLVLDYYYYPIPVYPPPQVIVVPPPYPSMRDGGPLPPPRPTMSLPYRRSAEERRDDPLQIIRLYLTDHGFKSVDINYLWSVENKTMCVSFTLRDLHLAIRYSDTAALAALAGTPRANANAKQQQAWETFVRSFEADGGSVYPIYVSGRDQIIAALDACQALHPSSAPVTEIVRLTPP